MKRRCLTRLAAVVLALSVLAGCGADLPFGAGREANAVGAELLAFANAGPGSVERAAASIDSPTKVAAFAGWFVKSHPTMADNLRAKMLAARPGGKRVLLAVPALGCKEDGARLRRHGDNLTVEFTGGEGTYCEAASQLVAVFAVKLDALPTSYTLQGRRQPRQVGPARLAQLYHLEGDEKAVLQSGDLRDPAVVERLLDGRDEKIAESVRSRISTAGVDDRVYGAVLDVCRGAGVELIITATTLTPAATALPDRPCAPATNLAFFSVDADFIPEGATIRS